MASLRELMGITESLANCECDNCGYTTSCSTKKGDNVAKNGKQCPKCGKGKLVCKMNESDESDELEEEIQDGYEEIVKESVLDSLEAILEMVENNSLDEDETTELSESIEYIFNSILDESKDEYQCNDDFDKGCGWLGNEEELVEDEDGEMVCPECGSSVSKSHKDLDEAMLKKSTPKQRKAAKKYVISAAGKKAKKIAAKKRKKYATKISRCSGKGKTFSLRSMTCVKSKKRR